MAATDEDPALREWIMDRTYEIESALIHYGELTSDILQLWSVGTYDPTVQSSSLDVLASMDGPYYQIGLIEQELGLPITGSLDQLTANYKKAKYTVDCMESGHRLAFCWHGATFYDHRPAIESMLALPYFKNQLLLDGIEQAGRGGHLNLVRFLVQRRLRIPVSTLEPAMISAVEAGDVALIKILVAKADRTDDMLKIAFQAAVHTSASADVFAGILSLKPWISDDIIRPGLVEAMQTDNRAAVEHLLEAVIHVNRPNIAYTLMETAIREDQPDMVAEVLSHSSQGGLSQENHVVDTAIGYRRWRVVDRFIALLSSPDMYERAALVAAQARDVEHVAAYMDAIPLEKQMAMVQRDIRAPIYNDGQRARQEYLFQYMVDRYADSNSQVIYTCFDEAVRFGVVACLEYLLSHVDSAVYLDRVNAYIEQGIRKGIFAEANPSRDPAIVNVLMRVSPELNGARLALAREVGYATVVAAIKI